MKTAELGGTRGYPYYRPGTGWIGGDRRRGFLRFRPRLVSRPTARISPLTTVGPRRPGLVTKVVIMALMVLVCLALWMVLGGHSPF